MRLPPARKKRDLLEHLFTLPEYSAVPVAVVPHCRAVPLGVLVRIVLERLLDPTALEQLQQTHAPRQYTRELTMQALVGLMIQVSAGSRASLFAAYQADQAMETPTISTTAQAVYQKLGRVEPALTEALVRFSAAQVQPLVERMPRAAEPVLRGYRTRILDGNVLTKTEHRLRPLRSKANGCLPGKGVVVYEPDLNLVTDLVLAEDAYAQERVLARELLPRVQPGDCWVADRHFCTAPFTFGVAEREGCFLVRQHQSNLTVEPLEELHQQGQTATGEVYEQHVRIHNAATGGTLEVRRIEVRLLTETRDGDRVIGLITNLPNQIKAKVLADVYLQRWSIEKLFQFITESLHCEVPGLGQPRAALFAFAMALLASNALAVVRASLRAAHGVKAEAEVSGYYLADEIGADYRTLMKYMPAEQWQSWRDMPVADLGRLLTEIAHLVHLRGLQRHPRGPKKPAPKRFYDRRHSHYSTYRLIAEDEDSC
jgi:Transposase DDE domain